MKLKRDTGKQTSISINWNVADDSVEVLSTGTGKLKEDNTASRLCKAEFAVLFKKVSKFIVLFLLWF